MWSLAASLAWAGCASPTHNVDVADAIDEAMDRYAGFDTEGFQAGVKAASEAAACLSDVVSPDVAAGLHRVRGLEAFLAKAVDVDRRTNAITEYLEDGLEIAEHLDGLDNERRKELPLYGLPISLKVSTLLIRWVKCIFTM